MLLLTFGTDVDTAHIHCQERTHRTTKRYIAPGWRALQSSATLLLLAPHMSGFAMARMEKGFCRHRRRSPVLGWLCPKRAVEWLGNEQRPLAFCLCYGRAPFVSFLTTETRLETVQIVIAH